MDNRYLYTIKRRIIVIGIFASILFISLVIRLYYLQIYKSEDFLKAAIKQRGKEISLYPKRGMIYDRNLVPLTNNNRTPMAIIDKEILKKDSVLSKKVKENSLLSPEEFYNLLNKKDRVLQIPLTDDLQLRGYRNIFLVERVKRYSSDNLLAHVIGYTNKTDNVGKSGIEKVYDEFLVSKDEDSFIVEFDKNRRFILDGIHHVNQRTEYYNPSAVKLTIDSEIQKRVESILDREKLNGAVIVSEVGTGKILSMVSRPNFNQDDIERYLDSMDMALYNKAVQVGYPPGSIFKIVVLLSALEEGNIDLDSKYHCDGFKIVNGVRINCSGTHGAISLREGFARSCNSTFIEIGQEIGARKVIDMAKKLGFGSKIHIGLLEEVGGNLPKDEEILGAAIGNISIGQGQLEVTPLQVSNLMTIVANGGISQPLHIVEGITNIDGIMIKETYKEPSIRIISKESTDVLVDFLREVVKSGTGKSIDLEDIGGCGGKTGSAEAILNKNRVTHGWFSGFYPADIPEYVITVFVEDARSGSISALPIFEEIAREISKYKAK